MKNKANPNRNNARRGEWNMRVPIFPIHFINADIQLEIMASLKSVFQRIFTSDTFLLLFCAFHLNPLFHQSKLR